MRYTTFGRTGLRVSQGNFGTREDYLAALEVELTADQYDRRTRVSEVPLGIPHDANARQLHSLQSGLSALIDGPRIPVA